MQAQAIQYAPDVCSATFARPGLVLVALPLLLIRSTGAGCLLTH